MSFDLIRRDKNLLEAANEIFGGLVQDAWVVTWESDHTPRGREDIERDFAAAFSLGDAEIYDCDIVLKFVSGAKVRFTVLENGFISRTKEGEFKEV